MSRLAGLVTLGDSENSGLSRRARALHLLAHMAVVVVTEVLIPHLYFLSCFFADQDRRAALFSFLQIGLRAAGAHFHVAVRDAEHHTVDAVHNSHGQVRGHPEMLDGPEGATELSMLCLQKR